MFANKQNKQLEKTIYFQYADYMFTVCYRYIGNREVAEELMNDGFIKAFKNLNRFENRHKSSMKNWIKKIMVNECLMFLRKKNEFELIHIESIPEQMNETDITNTNDNELLKIIQSLPVGYRTVFNLYAIEGYSHSEIAVQLGIKESTSRSQLTMARRILKSYLIKIGYELT